MERLPADRQRPRSGGGTLDAPVLDRPAVLAAIRRVLSRMPAAIAVSAIVEVPVAVMALALVSAPWSWVALGVANVLASGPVLALADSPLPLGEALRKAIDRGRDLLATAALESAAILAATLPAALLWLGFGIGPFGGYLTVLAAGVSGSRLALARPAVVLRDLSPTDALELSWDLVDGVAVEVGALYFAGVAASIGPAIGIAIVASALGLIPPVAMLATVAGLAVFGPLLPLALGEALVILEAHRRAVDPRFGRP